MISLHLFALNEKQRMEKVDECESECWMTDRVSLSLYDAKRFGPLAQMTAFDLVWLLQVLSHTETR